MADAVVCMSRISHMPFFSVSMLFCCFAVVLRIVVQHCLLRTSPVTIHGVRKRNINWRFSRPDEAVWTTQNENASLHLLSGSVVMHDMALCGCARLLSQQAM